jgi:EAL domain-containing protein (putative c-di-GMP-specific phosphodiesterase class I)
MRGIGVRIASAFGRGGATQDQLDLITPEIVKIDGVWFQKLCRETATVVLFGLLVSRFHDRGAKVLIDGIDDAAQLRVALRAGADLFQGDHLARAALVGTVFEETPLAVADLLAAKPNVLRFVR